MLGPLLSLPAPGRDALIETLDCWFAYGGEVAAVAETLYCHRNTVRSRLNRIAGFAGTGNPMEPNPPAHRRTT